MLFAQQIYSQPSSESIQTKEVIHKNESQKHRCGTLPPDEETKRYIFEEIISKEKERALYRNDATNCLPVKVHIVTETNGTGGLSLGDLAIAFANLNYVYYDADIEFFVCGDINYINNSDFYNFDGTAPDNDTENAFVLGEEVADAINVFFMNSLITSSGFNAAGYAYFPFNAAQSNRIFMTNNVADNAPNSTFSHELGHYFSLYHTHQGTSNGSGNANAERVVRLGANANCSVNGDLLCDTDADPRYNNATFDFNNCTYTGVATDDLGVTYLPTTAINNIMSYYPDQCGGVFTSGQFTRIASGLTTRLGHTAYDYSCSAAVIIAASNLTATQNGNQIDLTWTDNAANELGYIIERSTTSSATGFLPIIYGGVGENITAFSDTDISSSTSYWYRVRPVNAACDSYSNVAAITAGLIYCAPSYSNGCTNSILNDFSFNGDGGVNEINNANSGCVTSGYSNYTNLSASVTTQSTYSFTACKNLNYTRYLELWVDWNQDGDFEDANEQILNGTHSVNPCYIGSLTVPVGAASGSTVMRVIMANGGAPTNPCGAYSFGETEDYTLNVTNPLPVELTYFRGERKEETVHLAWNTATETNNDFFSLERSKDGISFEEIATINASRTPEQSNNYTYDDLTPFDGNNYYRLKQVDFDETTNYSKVVTVAINLKHEINARVIPNPIKKDKINLLYHAINVGDIRVRIVDLRGREIKEEVFNVVSSENKFAMDVSYLNAGIYFLQIQQDTYIQTIRFVKL